MLDILPELENFWLPDGTINEGEFLRFWRREIRGWNNTQAVVNLYNNVLKTDPISVRGWQRMEKANKVPVDKKRRWVIATILAIPSAYFHLSAAPPFFPRAEPPMLFTPSLQKTFDLKEYEHDLYGFWKSYYPRSNAADEIFSKIQTLEDALIYGGRQEREQIAHLLCEYLILFGNIRRDQGYSSAFNYLNKAILLTKEKGYSELLAKALYLRGYCFLDRWTLLRKTERTDLSKALDDFEAAQKIVKTSGLSPLLEVAISTEWGSALAHTVQDNQDRRNTLAMIDKAGRLVTASGFQRDRKFLNINTEWYHIDKAEIFLSLNYPKDASTELTNVAKGNPQKQRRYLSMDIAEARAYVLKGQVEMSVAYAESTLDIANTIQSCRHLTRVANLYEELKANRKYSTSPDVARLGLKLLKLQQPELFVD